MQIHQVVPVASQQRTRCMKFLACVAAVLLAACSTPALPPPPVAPPTVSSTLPTDAAPPDVRPVAGAPGGRVLGRSERFVIYQPAAGDTLRSIAGRFLGSESHAWVVGEFNGVGQVETDRPLVVPLQSLNPLGVHADQYQTVPILCYHRFSQGAGGGDGRPANAGKMVVSTANFAAQLDWLARSGYHVIPLAQLVGFMEGRQALPRRSVVITIDDGYESVQRLALPLLRKHGFPATVFVYTDFIGAADALSWTQLQDLLASGLIDVQVHSKTHRNLIDRDAGDPDERYRQMLETETRVPREALERRLPVQVMHYAFPYGDANQALLDALTRQRYQLGLTVNPGGNGFFAQPLMLRRTMIYGDQDLAAFKLKLQTARGIGAP